MNPVVPRLRTLECDNVSVHKYIPSLIENEVKFKVSYVNHKVMLQLPQDAFLKLFSEKALSKDPIFKKLKKDFQKMKVTK